MCAYRCPAARRLAKAAPAMRSLRSARSAHPASASANLWGQSPAPARRRQLLLHPPPPPPEHEFRLGKDLVKVRRDRRGPGLRERAELVQVWLRTSSTGQLVAGVAWHRHALRRRLIDIAARRRTSSGPMRSRSGDRVLLGAQEQPSQGEVAGGEAVSVERLTDATLRIKLGRALKQPIH